MLVSWNTQYYLKAIHYTWRRSQRLLFNPWLNACSSMPSASEGSITYLSLGDRILEVAAIFQDTFMFLILFGGMILW